MSSAPDLHKSGLSLFTLHQSLIWRCLLPNAIWTSRAPVWPFQTKTGQESATSPPGPLQAQRGPSSSEGLSLCSTCRSSCLPLKHRETQTSSLYGPFQAKHACHLGGETQAQLTGYHSAPAVGGRASSYAEEDGDIYCINTNFDECPTTISLLLIYYW